MIPSSKPTVFIIVLNFNGKYTLSGCLSYVYRSDYPNFEVIVVDNNSEDGSLEQARNTFSRAHFIKNSVNLGFSKGNNIGIRHSLEKFADYVFLLNNDTLLEKTALSNLIKAIEKNPTVGIASPLIYDFNDKIWFAGGSIDWNKMKTQHLYRLESDLPYGTEYLSGCAMLIKKSVFKKIGLFDERFFLYYEDADFSVRAKKAGFDLMVVPTAKLKHLEQSTINNAAKIYWLVISGLIFFLSNASLLQKIWLYTYIMLRKIKNYFDLFFRKNSVALEVHRAYKDFRKIYNG